MDPKLRIQKLKMWRGKLAQLEEELKGIYAKKEEAAKEGDLRENAAYHLAVEDADTWRVRIIEIKKIIADLEKDGKDGKR